MSCFELFRKQICVTTGFLDVLDVQQRLVSKSKLMHIHEYKQIKLNVYAVKCKQTKIKYNDFELVLIVQ